MKHAAEAGQSPGSGGGKGGRSPGGHSRQGGGHGTVKTALVLTGGGARAAYQVGVLKAISEMLPDRSRNPFPIISGTSAGAINAATLASWAGQFERGVERLESVWRNFSAHQVYHADPAGIGSSAARWLSALAFGWVRKSAPRSLLNNAPLRQLLTESLDFGRIDEAVASGALHSLGITCSGYSSGHSVTFYQGHSDVRPWRRHQRVGLRAQIGIDHLMASSAIPFVFPAVHMDNEWYGDGSMRQITPLAPAIHLGADKVLVIGAGRMKPDESRVRGDAYPSLAQIAGHMFSSIFLDSMYVDIEQVTRINHALSAIPKSRQREKKLNVRPIDVLVIAPSERLDHLAAQHAGSLPWAVRDLLRGFGAMRSNGGALVSYLLFERTYTETLVNLGYADARARRAEVLRFLA